MQVWGGQTRISKLLFLLFLERIMRSYVVSVVSYIKRNWILLFTESIAKTECWNWCTKQYCFKCCSRCRSSVVCDVCSNLNSIALNLDFFCMLGWKWINRHNGVLAEQDIIAILCFNFGGKCYWKQTCISTPINHFEKKNVY